MSRPSVWARRAVTALLVIAVTWALFRATGLQLAELDAAELARLQPAPSMLALSTAALIVVYLSHAFLWRAIVTSLTGTHLAVPPAMHVYFLANLVRYLPGKVWQVAGLAVLARRAGVSGVGAVGSAVVGQLAFLSTGAALAAALLPQWFDPRPVLVVIAAAAIAVVTVVIAGRSGFGAAIGRWANARWGERWSDVANTLRGVRPRQLAGWILAYGASWIVLGGAFTLFVMAFAHGAAVGMLQMTGTIAAAYLVGYAAVFAPAGIGVREGFLSLLLTQIMPAPAAAVVAVSSRLWFTAAELLLVAMLPLLPSGRAPAGGTSLDVTRVL